MTTPPVNHPRRPPAIGLWLGLSAAVLILLLALRGAGVLPLNYARGIGPLPVSLVLGFALLAAVNLTLPLAIALQNRAAWRAWLRPSLGKVLTTLGLACLVPAAILEGGMPILLIPLYAIVAVAEEPLPSPMTAAATIALILALLYPAVAALIWRLQRKTRPVALLGLPIGLYCLLALLGGNF